MEGSGFRDGIHKFEAKNAVILGMSFDSVEENRAFAEKFSFPFLLLSDPDRSIGSAYHAAPDSDREGAKRVSYLIDPQGNIARAYAKVDVKIHADEVLKVLDKEE